MNPLAVARSLLDSLWSIIDPDEPLFCDCTASGPCLDCSLSSPVQCAPDWSGARGASA